MVDSSKAFAKLNRLKKRILAKANVTVTDTINYGFQYAKQYAPYASGQTYDHIQKRKEQTNSGPVGMVFIKYGPRQNSPYTTTELVSMMDSNIPSVNGIKITNKIRTGSPNFFSNTRKQMDKMFRKRFGGNFRNIKGG